MIGTLFSNACQTFPRLASSPMIINPWSLILIRTKVKHYFPRPNEVRRIKRHGWNARMSTLSGRKVLMRRILKGKYVLSH